MSKNLIKVSPEALLETIIELRFTPKSDTPSQAIFGMVYSALKKNYKKVISSQSPYNLPPHIRIEIQQPETLFSENISIGITNNSIVFNCKNEYIGWKDYIEIIQRDLKDILSLDIIENFDRTGLRYVSFFEDIEDIFKYTDLKYSFLPYICKDTSIATIIEKDNIKTILRVSSGANLNKNNKQSKGSITDIDSSFENKVSPNIKDIIQIINSLHSREKEIFQNLIKEEKVGNYEFKYN